MVVDVMNMEGQKVSTVDLPSEIFEAPILMDLMHQAFVRQMANARLGTHATKTRHDVAGGGKRPWKQKGTGRARQGSIRSAQWVGGGKIHTPHPRDYTQAMPKKMRRSALRSALSVKASEQRIVLVDEMKLAEPKTRLMASSLDKLTGSSSTLVVIPGKDGYTDVIRSTNNLPYAKVILAQYLNIRDLMKFDHLVMPVAVLDSITGILG
ncbi:MAG: 50S ribosomal protein L4 [Anaerolineaceae bacterium]|nr:50S ribosomal protein L4 [Anaerolineaceae bacterium]